MCHWTGHFRSSENKRRETCGSAKDESSLKPKKICEIEIDTDLWERICNRARKAGISAEKYCEKIIRHTVESRKRRNRLL